MQLRTLVALVVFATAARTQIPIVAHWAFDEATGSTASDSGPNANHGSLANFAGAQWVPGQLGNALQFDGVDDYVLINPVSGLPLYDGRGTPFSIAFWINAPAQSDRRVYSEQAAAPTGLGPLFTLGSGTTATNTTGKLRVFVRTDDATTVASFFSAGTVFDGTWHHVAYSDVSGRAQIWIDGVRDIGYDYRYHTFGPRSSERGSYSQINSLTLGAVVRNGAIATPLAGSLDDLRVYQSALSDGDVALLLLGIDPPVCTASIGEYGYGCGPGPLDLAATGSAALGNTVYLQLFRGEPGALAIRILGYGEVQPIDLAPLGYPGCTLYHPQLEFAIFGALGASGSSPVLAVTVPSDPALVAGLFGLQGAGVGVSVQLAPVALLQVGI